MFLRNEHLNPAAGIHIDLRPTDPHVVTHGRIRQLVRSVLLHEPGQDPAGSMTLLGGAVVSSVSMASIECLNASSRGDDLTGVFRAGGRGSDNACRTVSLPI
ncbi:hypothetical protein ASG92_26000 [Arthrobacter sp. Soil736]|nr:hypothetical protein ASG92_26000 [Arthrobacter sp. Soil736]